MKYWSAIKVQNRINLANLLEAESSIKTNKIFICMFIFFAINVRPKSKRGRLEERSESHLGFTFWISLNSVRFNVSSPPLFPSLSLSLSVPSKAKKQLREIIHSEN
jgi:hypothetical protein